MNKRIELTAEHLRQIANYLDDPEDLCQTDIGYFTAEEVVKLLNDELVSFVIQDPENNTERIVMSDPKERAQVAYDTLSNFANGDRVYSDLIGEAMIHDHPLLQAYVTGIMLDCIKAMAENDHVTPQNEAAVKLCKEIQESIGEHPQYL